MTSLHSKVMKAAWKIFKKSYKNLTMKNWSKALKRAWKWAREKLMTVESDYRVWTPKSGFGYGRAYFSDNSYIEIRNINLRGSYDAHRACKGEVPVRLKAIGELASKYILDVNEAVLSYQIN